MRLTDEYVKTIKALWLENRTSGEIVNYFKGVFTRSQIVGKLWRMGVVGNGRTKVLKVQDEHIKRRIEKRREMDKRKQMAGEATVLRPQTRSDGLPWAKPAPMPTPSNAARRSFNSVSGPSYSILDLGMFQCHWPLGSPGDRNFAFCAAPTLGNHSYCRHHCAVAYRPR